MMSQSEIMLLHKQLHRAEKQLRAAEGIIYTLADLAEADWTDLKEFDSTIAWAKKLASGFRYSQ